MEMEGSSWEGVCVSVVQGGDYLRFTGRGGFKLSLEDQ